MTLPPAMAVVCVMPETAEVVTIGKFQLVSIVYIYAAPLEEFARSAPMMAVLPSSLRATV